MEPHAHLSAEEKKALFTSVTITHRQLEAVHDRIRRAIRQPAGFSFVLLENSIVLSTPLETNEQRPDLLSERLFASK